MNNTGDYLGVLTPNEIDRLHASISAEARHPLVTLAKATKPHPVAANTENAARSILRKDKNWITKLKPRLLDTSDFTNSSSALGEIRGFGALLNTAIAVNPKPGVPGKKVITEGERRRRAGHRRGS